MKKMFIGVILLSMSILSINAELVTSSKEGGIIKELPEQGQLVKKGQMLVVFSQTGINAQIDELKVEIEIAKEELKAKTLDMNRANTLVEKHSISKNEWEGINCDYNTAKLNIDRNNAKMRKLESDKDHCFIPAPYDCKVTKVILTKNSGTDIGGQILEIERLDKVNKTVARNMESGNQDHISVDE